MQSHIATYSQKHASLRLRLIVSTAISFIANYVPYVKKFNEVNFDKLNKCT